MVETRLKSTETCLDTIYGMENTQEQKDLIEKFKGVSDLYDRIPEINKNCVNNEKDPTSDPINIDWGGMKRAIDRLVLEYNNLIFGAKYYIVPYTDDDDDKIAYQKYVPICHKQLLDEWEQWKYQVSEMLFNKHAYGLGIFYWKDESSWKFESLDPINLLTPPNAKLPLSNLDHFAIKTTFSISKLIEKLKVEKESEEMGYITSEIKKIIVNAKKGEQVSYEESTESEETEIIDGLLNDSMAFKNKLTIEGYIFYVKEFSGKFSEYHIIPHDKLKFRINEGSIFYKKVESFDKAEEILALFPSTHGKGYIKRLRGYGLEAEAEHITENKMYNRVASYIMLMNSLYYSSDNEEYRATLGNFLEKVPEGLEIQQFQGLRGENLLQNMQAGELLLQGKYSRTRQFSDQQTGTKTAQESRLRFELEQKSKSDNYLVTYQQLSSFYLILWKKIIESKEPSAQKFLEKLKKYGVSEKQINNTYRIDAMQALGDGDPARQYLLLSQIAPYYGSLNVEQQDRYRRLVFETSIGYDTTDHILGYANQPKPNEKDLQESQEAFRENAILANSNPLQAIPIVSGLENHIIHIPIHLQLAERIILADQQQAYTSQFTLQTAVNILSNTLEHTGQHLQLAQGNQLAKDQIKVFAERFANAQAILKKMTQNLSEQQQAEQQRIAEFQQRQIEVERLSLQKEAKSVAIQENLANSQMEIARLTKEKAQLLQELQQIKETE